MRVGDRHLGPNLTRLLIRRASVDAVPTGGGLESAIAYLLDGGLAKGVRPALQWCDESIEKLRKAGEPNPFKDRDEEYIAGEILARVQKRETKT